MGQTYSGQYLVNKTKKHIIRQDDFLDENIYKIIKKINETHGWTLDDEVEYVNIDSDNNNLDYLENLVVVQSYKADPSHFPAHWFDSKRH